MVRAVLPEIFPADIFVADFSVRTVEPTAFVTEKFNLVFFLYDYTIEMVEKAYVNWFRPTYFGKKKQKKHTDSK